MHESFLRLQRVGVGNAAVEDAVGNRCHLTQSDQFNNLVKTTTAEIFPYYFYFILFSCENFLVRQSPVKAQHYIRTRANKTKHILL